MSERQYTRVDTVRKYVDEMLKASADPGISRNGYVHLYGTGQAGALIALHRGYDRSYAELAQIAGMLHDYAKYRDGIAEQHAERSSEQARKILEETGQFSAQETDMICHAIGRHSCKAVADDAFSEILKDADEMQHWLRNPVEEYPFQKPRVQKLIREFSLAILKK